jgi:hypothetical protein
MDVTQKKSDSSKNVDKKRTAARSSTVKPAKTTKTETAKAQVKKADTADKVSVSKESGEKTEDGGRFNGFLSNLQAGFEVNASKDRSKGANPLTELKGKDLKQQLDKLPPEQKPKLLLDSLKGMKGKDLENRLSEIEKVDPALAEKLREELGLKKKEKEEVKPGEEAKAGDEPAKAEAGAEAQKAGGPDDGAPSETFLWKPKSESDGNLVVLLPSSESARSVTISGPNVNQTVNKGGRNGKRANGQREHFRFGQSGESMKGPVQVTVQTENGQSKTMTIANPAQRNEGGQLKEGGAGGGQF